MGARLECVVPVCEYSMSAVITSQVQVPGVGAEDATWRSGEGATLEEVLEPLDTVQVHQHLDVVEGWWS